MDEGRLLRLILFFIALLAALSLYDVFADRRNPYLEDYKLQIQSIEDFKESLADTVDSVLKNIEPPKNGVDGADGLNGFNGTNGEDGKDGNRGEKGSNGREIQLRTNSETKVIEWKYNGDSIWAPLVSYCELTECEEE